METFCLKVSLTTNEMHCIKGGWKVRDKGWRRTRHRVV